MQIKIKLSFILALLCYVPIFGQRFIQSSESYGITVVSKKWKFVKKVGFAYLSSQEEQQRNGALHPNSGGLTGNDIGKAVTIKYYTYAATLKNDCKKSINEITWEYVFFDITTKKELDRHHFVSQRILLRPGSTRKIIASSDLPPTKVISAKSADKNYAEQYTEEIQIKSIRYSDGSTWEYGTP